jgi:hypothetical protein
VRWWWLVPIAVVLFGLYLAWTSTRLDRLHARVDAARAALDAQLVRRSAVTLELAASGLLDPASSLLLASVAHSARAASVSEREVAESDLTRALLAALDGRESHEPLLTDPAGEDLVTELDASSTKVQLARRFHNDAVRATLAVRRKGLVRALRLAGHAPEPRFFEMEDTPVGVSPGGE